MAINARYNITMGFCRTLYCRLNVTTIAEPVCCVFRNPGALTFGYGCTVHVGVDVGAGDIEVDAIYIDIIHHERPIHRVLGGVQRLEKAGIRRFRPRGGHQNSPFLG